MSFKFFSRGIVATVAVLPTFTIFVVCLPGSRPAIASRSQPVSRSFFLCFKFNYYLWDEQICAIFSSFSFFFLHRCCCRLALPVSFSLCSDTFRCTFFVGTVGTIRETAKAKIKLISDLLIESSPFFPSPSSSYSSSSSSLFHLLVCRWVCMVYNVRCTRYGRPMNLSEKPSAIWPLLKNAWWNALSTGTHERTKLKVNLCSAASSRYDNGASPATAPSNHTEKRAKKKKR